MKFHLLAGVSLLVLGLSCSTNKQIPRTLAKADSTPVNVTLKFKAPTKQKNGRTPTSLPDGLTPNSVRYSDHGAQPQTGRSGIYQIMSRALLDKAGNTTLEVSSGDFATAPMEGTHLTKIQLKGFNSEGAEVFAENFNSLVNNGSWIQGRTDLSRHQKFQILSHLSKDGIKRNFVITNESVVYILPDLKADKIVAQEQAYDHEPINIVGEVVELNNDLGAHADCVLFVDGSEVARTAGIWVDSGDRVSCVFSRQFDSVGTHTIKFAVDNIKPNDYDSSNNSVEKTINIVSHENLLSNYYFYFTDSNSLYDYSFRYTNMDYSGSYHMDRVDQQVNYAGVIAESIGGGGEFTAHETSGTNTMTWSGMVPTYDGCSTNPYWACYDALDYASNRFLHIRKAKYTNYSYVYFTRYGGRVIYHGIGAYSYVDNYNSEWGPRLPLVNNEYNLEVKVASGVSNFVGRISRTLRDSNTYSDSGGERCYDVYYSYYGQRCEKWTHNYTMKIFP